MADRGSKKTRVLPFAKKGVDLRGGKVSNIDINASFSRRDPPLENDALRTVIARVLNFGTFRQTFHSSEERGYRNISNEDIMHSLVVYGRLTAGLSMTMCTGVGSTD